VRFRWAFVGVVGFVITTAQGIVAPEPARAQLSPGPLSQAHESLEGNRNCTKCHGLGHDSIDPNCLECHTEIQWSITQGVGLHARQRDTSCARCHPEHAGRDFDLIDWGKGGRDGFDHGQTGFPLEGKHARIDCDRCHTSQFQSSPVAHMIKSTKERSHLGLESRCGACHGDVHEQRLGEECQECHDATGWRNTPRFDHRSTGYVLRGKHETLECAKCHDPKDSASSPGTPTAPESPAQTAAGTPRPRYGPLPRAECSDCHRDPHQARLGPLCSKCHVEEGFRLASTREFDHGLSRFPLRGRHVVVTCESCHDEDKAWGKRPPFARCADCHVDPHGGQTVASPWAASQEASPAASPDCELCHDEAAFKPSTFTLAQHAATGYPLEGRHRDVACPECHGLDAAGTDPSRAGSAKVWLRPRFDTCATCHGPAHGNQLAHRPDGDRCESCHTVAGFKPSTFTAVEHATLKLPLSGRHGELACSACHGLEREGLPAPTLTLAPGEAGVALALQDTTCVACHIDPHEGRYAATGESPVPGAADDCLVCHDPRRFRPAVLTLDTHAALGFALDGAHRAVPCIACHAELMERPVVSTLVLGGAKPAALSLHSAPTSCASCHPTPHGSQFDDRADGGRCDSCHGTTSFVPAVRFDHERDTPFRLVGAHARVPCDRCHPTRTGPDGESTVVYRPLDIRCESCHAANGQARPLPKNAETPGPNAPITGGARGDS
jgi:hypothetical protein